MPNRTADLHAHTTASDGDHSPTDLVRHAAEIGLKTLAVTDHDTTGGLGEAIEAGSRLGIEVVPGIELSAEFSRGQCHLLGLFINPEDAALNGRLQEVLDNRNRRNAIIVRKLQDLGIDITLEEIEAESGGTVVARPHFAKVLIAKGVVADVKQAFAEYLDRGAKAYVERDRLMPEEAIGLIHGAGGVAILAHPNNMKRDPEESEKEILKLQAVGLDGIEARYNLHTPADTARYLSLAERHGLLTSGGSDFHGPSVKPKVLLGHVEGDLPAPDSVVSALKAALPAH
jgi:predicted metal-dependent phosphoesterase TrpH